MEKKNNSPNQTDNVWWRPNNFKKEYIKILEDYFDIESNELKEVITTWKNDYQKIDYKEFASNLPTIQWFCKLIKINRSTFYNWLQLADNEEYKEKDKEDLKNFSNTYKMCQEIQEAIWQENSLKWLYNPAFAIFLWKNVFNRKDKTEVETTLSWELKTTSAVDKMNSLLNK